VFREAYIKTKPVMLEPIMTVEVLAPVEFRSVFTLNYHAHCAFPGTVIGGLNACRGTIIDSEVHKDEFMAMMRWC